MNSVRLRLALAVAVGMIAAGVFLTGTRQTVLPPTTATAQPRVASDDRPRAPQVPGVPADAGSSGWERDPGPSSNYFLRRAQGGRIAPEEGACLRSCLQIKMECLQAVLSERIMQDVLVGSSTIPPSRVVVSPSLQTAKAACLPVESLCLASCPQ